KDLPRIAEISLDTSPDGHTILASVRNGDGGEIEHFVRGDDGVWKQINKFSDPIKQASLGFDGNVYLLSKSNSMGAILRVPLTKPVNFNDAVVDRVMVTSKDGTKVPLNIMHRRDMKLDGTNPTVLSGYGGFNISIKPGFGVGRRLWFDHGGISAIANLRGGGE